MAAEIYRKRIKYVLECSYELQANLEILKDEIIQDTAAICQSPAPKTTHFGSEPGGSGRNASPEELFCIRKEEAERRLEVKKQRYHDTLQLLARVEKGLALMPGDQSRILKWKAGYNCRRMTWNQIAHRLNCGDASYCRRRYSEALDVLTGIVYGVEAAPIQGVLDLDDSEEQSRILDTHISTEDDRKQRL